MHYPQEQWFAPTTDDKWPADLLNPELRKHDVEEIDNYRRSRVLLYGAETVCQAEALLNRSKRFFGLEPLSVDMQGSAMHQTLLTAYDKLFAADR